MILRLSILLFALWLGSGAAFAQTDLLSTVTGQGGDAPAEEEAPPPEEQAADVAPPAPGELAAVLPVFEEWDTIATRAEETLRRPETSAFTLNRLWDELFDWRDRFEVLDDKNAGRIDTLTSQIRALTLAEGMDPPEIILARIAELTAQRDDLLAPRLLAQEAYARADGLISEVDAQLRARDFADVTQRAPSPLLPSSWPAAVEHLRSVLAGIGSEFGTAYSALFGGNLTGRILPASLLILFGIGLLTIGRAVVSRWATGLPNDDGRGAVIWRFVSALLALFLPGAGLILLVSGLAQLSIFGQIGQDLLEALVPAGLTAIVGWWLSARFFPEGARMGPLHYAPAHRIKLRRAGLWLAFAIAFGILWEAMLQGREVTDEALLVLLLPIHLVSSFLLFRFGRLLRQPPDAAEDGEEAPGTRMRGILGQAIMAIAIVAPVLAVLGFGAATQALITPAVQTLAVLGIVVLLQRLANDVAVIRKGGDGDDAGPLAPILLGFGFFLLSLPVLALIWGARASDLWDLWARFRAGVQLGETQISPGDMLTVLIVFAIGYLVTRFLQGALRGSVLPRTKLDRGAQNAIVSGFGYVGITLAALVAITSAGIDLSSFAIVAGALSVGIGFGLQTVVSNFVSGIILLIERPVSEGDWIEINGQMGYVRDISVRSTRIETFDRTDVIVPNADLISQQVINWTRGNSVGRAKVAVGVAYGSDVDRVKEILQEVAMEQPMVLHNPPPTVLFLGFGDSSLNFEVRAILRDVNFVLHVQSDIGLAINRRLNEEGIEIPFPQRDIWMRSPKGAGEAPEADE